MQHLSTAFLIIPLVIVVYQGSGVTAHDGFFDDPLTLGSKHRAVTIIAGPKYVPHSTSGNQTVKPDLQTHKPEVRPPSKPPSVPIKPLKRYHVDIPRPHHGHIQKIPPPRLYPKKLITQPYTPNSIYKYPRVIPLPARYRNPYYYKSRPLVHAASIGKPSVAKSPKFSLPAHVVNGIRADFVKPPKLMNTTTTSTTTTEATTTTTQKVLRTKRIWPSRALEKLNSTSDNTTVTENSTIANDNSTSNYNTTLTKRNTKPKYNETEISIADDKDQDTSESRHHVRYVYSNATADPTTVPTPPALTTRRYRPVTRTSKVKTFTTTTLAPFNYTRLEYNDWVPILPSHYPYLKKPAPTPINKRSDKYTIHSKAPPGNLYLQSFGLIPVKNPHSTPAMARKKMVFFKRKRQLNPYYSGSSPRPRRPLTRYSYGDLETDGSHSHPRSVTKIKHHHHHHHHRYIKTVEKPIKVPYKVEVPKPYPVHVEKKVPVEKIKVVEKPMPYPVHVEKKIPYPIGIKVPVPYKVVEKEYIPKPYPIIHHVPVVKHVQVEKKVPYPVEVKVPVDRPVAVPVHVEKQVPYPVPVRVLVPQPYPVETKVPYPVEVKVKEPFEVIKHVPVRVPYPQPYAVKVPHPVPVPVEKRVPYPVEVEKKVPVKVYVPQRVEVEKRVPVYIPKPYPVEKRVPYPVKVPYPVPVKVPVRVPVEVPVHIHHPYSMYNDNSYQYDGSNVITVTPALEVTSNPLHTVTVHGNTGFSGFQDRSDQSESTTMATPITPDS